ncbi:MAG: hypothetical protein QM784_02025 [Polyangiaceae bacterium]
MRLRANKTVAVPSRSMAVGINYMWGYNKYGLYFGTHWRFGEAERELWMDDWLTEFECNLTRWRQDDLRVSVVRIFLYCNLQSYGSVSASGRWELPSPGDARYPAFMGRYLSQFEEMLRICARTGMKLIPSLVDFGIGAPLPHLEREQRWSIITDRSVRDQFFAQAMVPLLEISQRPEYRTTLYAWEVMNEPSWLTGSLWPRPGQTPKVVSPRVTQSELWEFLHKGVSEIHSRGLPSTVGHRFYDDMSTYPTGLGPQFHYYPAFYNADPTPLPHYNATDPGRIRRAILGEFAAGTEGNTWTGLFGRDEPGARERVRERLLEASRLGYRLSVLWPDLPPWGGPIGAPDPKLSSEALDGIRDYWSAAP